MAIKTVLKKLFIKGWFDKETKVGAASTAPRLIIVHNMENCHTMVYGTVCIHGGKVIVTDPEDDGSYATFIVPANPAIRVFVDEEQVQGEIVLYKSQSIVIKFSDVEPTVTYEASVSNDELSVTVQAKVTKGVKLSLKDSSPSRHIALAIEEILVDPIPSRPEVILNLLSEHGYKGKIDYDAMNHLCNSTETLEEVVLRGVAPKSGLPAKFRICVTFQAQMDEIFRTSRCSAVSIGTTVAVIEPGTPGVPGKNIYGVSILPIKAEQRLPKIGIGVINVNRNIVAVRDGRLKYTKQVIDVIPQLIIDHDVSKRDGKIRFDGDVTIHGSVIDDGLIKASGTVMIYGNVDKSSVFGEKGVLVQEGIHGSKIVSGYQQILYGNLSNLLNKLIPQLERFKDEYLLTVAYVVKKFNANATLPKIPALLFEKRHKELEGMLSVFVDDYKNELSDFDDSYRILKELIESTWRGTNRFKIIQDDINVLLDKIATFNNEVKGLQKEASVVRASNIISSLIRSIGNIIVTGNCQSSTLESESTISIQRTLRGGFVVAKRSVYVTELGSPSGVETSVRVTDHDGFISAKMKHPNTLMEVNGRRLNSYNTELNVWFGNSR